ncbi:MAG: DUF2171 domain-containing protein [Dehalococcoidia bacterium]
MNSTAVEAAVGDLVLCADGEPLGRVDGDEGTHLRVRRAEHPPLVWTPKSLITDVSDHVVHLLLPRDDLHDGVIALTPSRQREFGTIATLSLLVERARMEQSRQGN